jgi:hypothetical protein
MHTGVKFLLGIFVQNENKHHQGYLLIRPIKGLRIYKLNSMKIQYVSKVPGLWV